MPRVRPERKPWGYLLGRGKKSTLDKKIESRRPAYERKKDARALKSELHWKKKEAHMAHRIAVEAKRWERRDARLVARRAAGGTFEYWREKRERMKRKR